MSISLLYPAAPGMLNDTRHLAFEPVEVASESKYWGPKFVGVVLLIWGGSFVYGFQNALVALTVLGFVGMLAGLRAPAVGLLSIGILCTIDALSRVYLLTGGLLRYNTFNYLLLFVALVGSPTILARRDPHTRWLAALLGLLLVELFLSPGIKAGVLHILNAFAAFGLLFYFVRGCVDQRAWYWLAMVNGCVAGFGGLIFYLQRSQLPPIDQNAFAYFPLTALFSICLAFRQSAQYPRGQLILGLLAAVNLTWLFLTGSRAGTLTGVFCLICLISGLPSVRQQLMVLLAGTIVGAGLSGQFDELNDRAVYRFTKVFDTQRSLSNRTSGRSELVKGGLQIFWDQPLAGVGTGGYSKAWMEYSAQERASFKRGQVASSHSAWLKTLAENGIPGLVVLACYVFSFAYVGFRRPAPGTFLGLLASGSLSMAFLATEFQGKGLWFLAAGVTVQLHSEMWRDQGEKR